MFHIAIITEAVGRKRKAGKEKAAEKRMKVEKGEDDQEDAKCLILETSDHVDDKVNVEQLLGEWLHE